MSDDISNNKRIAKNTIFLYLRTLFVMGVSLYTSRVILKSLGFVDFGIYNVVGGFVAFFAFLNSAMTSATQRFIIYDLAKGDLTKVNTTFNTALLIHLFIGIIVVLIIEPSGGWFIVSHLTIPAERIIAAKWVFHCSVISLFFSMVSVPYISCLIAHENMKVFAYMSIIEATLRLVVAYLITISFFDRLISYAVLILLTSVVVWLLYAVYISYKYVEVKMKLVFKADLIMQMGSFAAWNLIGNLALVGTTQGVNMILNIFFGPVVNAARGIAVQCQSAVQQFTSNFQMALNPQITKCYANRELHNMYVLICRSAKFSFFLLFLIALPLLFVADFILDLWLDEVPAYSSIFLQLILIASLLDTLSNPLNTAMNATGKIRNFQIINGLLMLLILPISWFSLTFFDNPILVFVIQVAFTFITHFVKLSFVKKITRLPIHMFVSKVYFKIFFVVVFSWLPVFVISKYVNHGIFGTLLLLLFSIIISTVLIYFVGLEKGERVVINNKITSTIIKIRK